MCSNRMSVFWYWVSHIKTILLLFQFSYPIFNQLSFSLSESKTCHLVHFSEILYLTLDFLWQKVQSWESYTVYLVNLLHHILHFFLAWRENVTDQNFRGGCVLPVNFKVLIKTDSWNKTYINSLGVILQVVLLPVFIFFSYI